jgi:N-acetylglutamate synthase-like GNAT family acetyltransferase
MLSYTFDKSKFDSIIALQWVKSTPWGKKRDTRLIKKSFANSIICAAFFNNKQVGFIRVTTDKCFFAHLADIYIDIESRKSGIGKELLRQVIQHPDCQNVDTWFLTTTTAKDYFSELGFKPVDSGKNYTCMRSILLSHLKN